MYQEFVPFFFHYQKLISKISKIKNIYLQMRVQYWCSKMTYFNRLVYPHKNVFRVWDTWPHASVYPVKVS